MVPKLDLEMEEWSINEVAQKRKQVLPMVIMVLIIVNLGGLIMEFPIIWWGSFNTMEF